MEEGVLLDFSWVALAFVFCSLNEACEPNTQVHMGFQMCSLQKVASVLSLYLCLSKLSSPPLSKPIVSNFLARSTLH